MSACSERELDHDDVVSFLSSSASIAVLEKEGDKRPPDRETGPSFGIVVCICPFSLLKEIRKESAYELNGRRRALPSSRLNDWLAYA